MMICDDLLQIVWLRLILLDKWLEYKTTSDDPQLVLVSHLLRVS